MRDRKYIIVVIILLSHRKYMNDNWRPGEMVLGSRLGLAFERGSDCACSACVGYGLSVALDSSQVIDLLS